MGRGYIFRAISAARRSWLAGVLLAVGLVAGSSVAGLRAGMTASTASVGEAPREVSRASGRYEFELVGNQVKVGGGAVLTLRLLDRSTGKLVPDATVFLSRIDMGPDGMADMGAPLDMLPDTLPGYYRFETDLLMAGGWAFTLAAKVPGNDAVAQSRLVLTVVP